MNSSLPKIADAIAEMNIDPFHMNVHPAADIFPMVADDQLASLVESIKANGLRYSIVVRKISNGSGEVEDELIDGRNRLRACSIAGVEPTFTVFDGDEDQVRAFIADVNLERRDLKKGQKAALYAKLFPDPERLKRKSDVTTHNNSFTRPQLSNCRSILRHSAALLDDVIADRMPLDAALARVKDEQAKSSSTEAKTEQLRTGAPDLADLVVDERMDLDEALAALETRQRKAEAEESSQRETLIRMTEAAYRGTIAWAVDETVAGVRWRLSDKEFSKQLLARLSIDPAEISNIRRGAEALATLLDQIIRKETSS